MTKRDRADFRSHVRLARRHALQRRLNRAALLLFGLALLTWAFSVPLAVQLGIVTAGVLAGFALPVRNAQDWSRAWIRSQAGLAYDTALQLGDSVRDEFGLRVTVRAHARTAIARMDQPQQQPWWLASAILGLLILLLPSLQFSPPWSSPPAGSPPPALQQDGSVAGEAEDDDSGDELQSEVEPPQLEVEAQPDSRGEMPAGQAGEAGEGGGDSAVLDRFLDHLREQPAEAADASGSPESQPDGGEQPLGSRGETAAEGEETADGDGGATGEGSTAGQEEVSADSEGEPGSGRAQDSVSTGEPGVADTGEASGTEDASGPDAPIRDAAGQPDDSALQQPETEAGVDGSADSEQAGAADSAEPGGHGAGADAGVELPGSEQRLSGPRAAPEFLEGDLAGDSASSGGSVRLPGFSDVDLPSGGSAAAYGRAAERAVTEGQIPVEYQDIIRDYFRP